MRRSIYFIFILFFVVGLYQACGTGINFSNGITQSVQSGSANDPGSSTSPDQNSNPTAPPPISVGGGNGDGYVGQPAMYVYYDSQKVCVEKDATGKPMPTRALTYDSSKVYIVRDNCNDIMPVLLSPAQYQIDPLGVFIMYQNQKFVKVGNFAAFNNFTSPCPQGFQGPGASGNLLDSSYDLSSAKWTATPGLERSLESSIHALPMYKLTRTGTNATNPKMGIMSSVVNLSPDRGGVHTFALLTDAGTTSHFLLTFEGSGCTLQVTDIGVVLVETCGIISLFRFNSEVVGRGRRIIVSIWIGSVSVDTYSPPSLHVGIAPISQVSPQNPAPAYRAGDSAFFGALEVKRCESDPPPYQPDGAPN